MGIKFIMVSVQVYRIVSYLDCFSKHTRENLKMQQVFVQDSISHTPKGTYTVRGKSTFEICGTSTEVHEASASNKIQGITPVARGGERIPISST
jgi:hypothetical protein